MSKEYDDGLTFTWPTLGDPSWTATVDAALTVISSAASTTAVADSHDALLFGDGSDGNVTITSGTTTLVRDMFYNNLTISGTGSLNPAGFRVFVLGTLDLSNAPASAIARVGTVGNSSTAFGHVAGATVSALGAESAGGSCSGLAGGNGDDVTYLGVPSASPTSLSPFGGAGIGGRGGSGGSPTTGAIGGTVSASGTRFRCRQPLGNLLKGGTLLNAVNIGGSGGGGGDGSVANGAGAGGGSAGAGGGVLSICARTIARGVSTTASAISVKGGAGGSSGNTGDGLTDDRCGGGGGGGGPGGWLVLLYRTLTGATATNCLDASGGAGGSGGTNISGFGFGGSGGQGGGGGTITLYNAATYTWTETSGSTGTAGTAGSGATGGAGGAGNTLRASL